MVMEPKNKIEWVILSFFGCLFVVVSAPFFVIGWIVDKLQSRNK